MRDVEIVPFLRRLHGDLAAREAKLRADVAAGARTPAFVEAELPRLRDAALTKADAVSAELREVRSAAAQIARRLPDPRDPNVALNQAKVLRQRPGAVVPDAKVLERTALDTLIADARVTDDPVTLAELYREIEFRATQPEHAADVGALPLQIARRLGELIDALPETVAARAEHDRLAHIIERSDDTLRAIREGGEDAGRRYDAYAVIRAQLDSGERTGPIDTAEIMAIAAAL